MTTRKNIVRTFVVFVEDRDELAQVRLDDPGGDAGRVDDEGHPRDARCLAVADGEALHVERAPAEHPHDPHEDARLVLHAGDQGVLHAATSAAPFPPETRAFSAGVS